MKPGTAARRLVLALAAALVAAPGGASRTQSWSIDPATLSRGEADGVSISRGGVLELAPRLSRIGEGEADLAAQAWDLVADRRGNLFVATGPEGRILRIDRDGRSRTYCTLSEPLVTALALTREGELLAAGAPGGVVYRIGSDGAAEAWSETGERYVWSLAVTDDGAVYAATGESGSILRLHPTGTPELFFDSDESHLVALTPIDGGGLLAGGAGAGRVYQIDADGNALVRYDDELDEVVALAAGADGDVFAALIAAPLPESAPPALRLRLPDGVEVAGSAQGVASLEETPGPTLRGVIEGLPSRSLEDKSRPRGRVVRVDRNGVSESLWSSASDAPFALVRSESGRCLFGTGEPARLYAIDTADESDENEAEVSLLATLPESQVTGLLSANRAIVAATSNPVAGYRIEKEQAQSGVFTAPPFDAGAPARWGSIRWKLDGDPTRAELYTRTGNSATPDDTWSAWSPSMIDPAGSPIDNPDGRYVQWRSRLIGGGGGSRPPARLSAVTLEYVPYNRPPRGHDFRLGVPAESISGEALFHCSVEDPDGDPVDVTLEYRPAGTTDWTVVADAAPDAPVSALPPTVDGWRKQELRWNTDERDEGAYEVRVVVSDEAANAPDQGRRVPLEPLALIVDRTPPELVIGIADARGLPVVLRDAHSRLGGLQLRRDGRVQATLRPEDGVVDSSRETFRVVAPDPGEGWSLVGVDAAGNTAELPLPPP